MIDRLQQKPNTPRHALATTPALEQTAPNLRRYTHDLFEQHFPRPHGAAQQSIAYGNNGRVELRRRPAPLESTRVAIKMQPKSLRSLREYALLHKAQSAHAIEMYDAFEVHDEAGRIDLAFVMPQAEVLPSFLQHTRSPLEARVLGAQVAQDMLSAVDFLHAMGIFHRDIKASNVLVRQGRAQLGDFGEAYAEPSRLFSSLYRWSDVRDAAALMVGVLDETGQAPAAATLNLWLVQNGHDADTHAVRDAFARALAAHAAPVVPSQSSVRYAFWRVVQLAEKEVDSVREIGMAMTVRQSLPQWDAARYDRQVRPWAYTASNT